MLLDNGKNIPGSLEIVALEAPGIITCRRCGTAYPAEHRISAGCSVCALGHARSHDLEAFCAGVDACGRGEIVFSEAEPGLASLSVEPSVGLGARAFYLDRFLFDCVPAFTDAAAAEIEALGGLSGILILHPLAYGAALSWAREFSVPILIHHDGMPFTPFRERVEEWHGERLGVSSDTELIRLAGLHRGGVIAHWRAGADGQGTLIAGENLHVLAAGHGVSFMFNAALAIPRSAHEVESLASQLGQIQFESLYGSLWARRVREHARATVIASARRYLSLIGRDAAALRLVA